VCSACRVSVNVVKLPFFETVYVSHDSAQQRFGSGVALKLKNLGVLEMWFLRYSSI
jgi:hypothetical protein